MYGIRQNGEQWEVVGADGAVIETLATREEAYAALGAHLTAQLAAGSDNDPEDGLLPDRWTDAGGICFSAETGDGRDFSQCQWSFRDPAVSLLPLMLQTETEYGHFGAQLAGFMETVSVDGTTPRASGRFYASDAGREFRDLLLGDRRFGVSVDPGHVAAEWECIEEDEDGWCIDAVVRFQEYEIIGLTGTPFPAFAEAAIVLDVSAAESDAGEAAASTTPATVAASGTLNIRATPPDEWFHLPEPTLGDERLVTQLDGGSAAPLTITDEGQVYAHIARWGQCHVGFPGQCVSPPESAAAYAHFHVGVTETDSGERVPTGTLTAGCDHALTRLRAREATDHYANVGVGWADVRVINGELGAWACGALRPDVTREQVRVLRASSLSGDWRTLGGGLELIGVLAVNVPGFPIAREALAASGLAEVPAARTRGASADGQPLALVAAGVVHRCSDCQRREAQAANVSHLRNGASPELASLVKEMARTLARIDRRTHHLVGPAREELATRIRGG